jgi:hypothetical protein
MYKLVIRTILISITVALILVLLFRNRLPYGKVNSSFASEPSEAITRIEFFEAGKKLTLKKKGESWVINEKSEARKSGILFILRILRDIKIKSPVSAEMFKSEITDKGIEPVKIRLYENRKLLKSYLVYKTSSNSYGNIMKIRKRSKPFIVYLPGYDGDIGTAFTLNELFWQPYTVFNLLPSEIESVTFENLSDTSSSFKISGINNQFILSDMNRELTGWDPVLVTRYLSYFAWIPFEKWALEMGEEAKKLVESTPPLYRITVITSGGKKLILTLWEKFREEHGNMMKDSDRLLGRTQSTNEFFIMKYFDIDPLLKRRSYFFQE